jgi:rare lipoprotein A
VRALTRLALSSAALAAVGCMAPRPVYRSGLRAGGTAISGMEFRGTASYYAGSFHGRRTANGETFDMNAMTCAHRTLPFGTMLEVRNVSNDLTVVVRVNDRGPYAGGRIIDLSRGAAERIGMLETGTAEVILTVLGGSGDG